MTDLNAFYAALGAFAAVAGVIGMILGLGVAWGIFKHSHKVLADSHTRLKSDYFDHKENRQIHIDPERDQASEDAYRESVTLSLQKIEASTSQVNERCLRRAMDCGAHFVSIEKKLAAATGKPNGETS
jgi:hypothetical protein